MDDRAKIILELVCSLNQGNVGYSGDRVDTAIRQYNLMIDKNIIEGTKIRL